MLLNWQSLVGFCFIFIEYMRFCAEISEFRYYVGRTKSESTSLLFLGSVTEYHNSTVADETIRGLSASIDKVGHLLLHSSFQEQL